MYIGIHIILICSIESSWKSTFKHQRCQRCITAKMVRGREVRDQSGVVVDKALEMQFRKRRRKKRPWWPPFRGHQAQDLVEVPVVSRDGATTSSPGSAMVEGDVANYSWLAPPPRPAAAKLFRFIVLVAFLAFVHPISFTSALKNEFCEYSLSFRLENIVDEVGGPNDCCSADENR